ncbi:inositol 2-dehydrogenase [Truepera radiovictrix]|uniref:Oxidoreductase domain protein n=1 Tax=Truepera radiovictrix (strain DSM 17093 / CIP 108686 / LMG 22925 / RQ-24) TaxID=649638 RepID=D7CWF7_TRURR|nr:inositol 2-dehydrogenase [Truepera radiovictrix]ADI14356.1 oxidoreductase domain protein [Truepera radiovictrix DSM 17093]WMT57087.1 inositol 2-dehydrogenase [Truepera radiovictrix]
MPSTRLHVALIGAGRMAQTHAAVLATLPGVRVRAVCDPREAAARALAEPLGAAAVTEAARVFDDPHVDAVLITTPTPTHAALVTRAAEAGKHVFVEKPVAATLEEAERVVAAVARAGVACQVGFQRRFDPAYVEAKRLVDAGELGALEGFRGVSRDPAPPPLAFLRSSGGLMVDLGIHDLDTARFFVGEVREVYAVGSVQVEPRLKEYGLFDTAVATLRFDNGALGTLELGLRTAYGYDVRAEILGERGRLHLEMDSRLHLRRYDAAGGSFVRPRGFEERFFDAYRGELLTFFACLRAGQPVSPDAADATKSLQLALAAQRSLETGSAVAVATFREGVAA